MGYRVAVVGATGNVGREICKLSTNGPFQWMKSSRLLRKVSREEVSFGEDEILRVQSLADFDFKGFDIGLFSPGAKVSAKYAPKAAAAGRSNK